MSNVHLFAPLTLGAFRDLVEDFRGDGWNVEDTGTHSANASSSDGNVKVRLVTDEDDLRVQLLKGPDNTAFWNTIESIVRRYSSVQGGADYSQFANIVDRFNSGDASLVREIQNALRDATGGKGKGTDESGVVDADTRALIKKFQRQSNIDATGKFDIVTAQALHVLVDGADSTRWDVLSQELTALESATVVGEFVDTANGERGPMVAGEPKTKTFSLAPDEVQKLLDGAKGKGMDVTKTGDNAYAIDTHKAGVKLSASYDTSTQTATISITNSDWYVSNSKVWDALQPIMPHHVAAAADATSATPTPSTKDAEGHVSYLEMAEQKVRNAWDKAQELDDAAKKRVREKAAAALDTAKDLAKDVEQGLRATGGALHDRAEAVKKKLKDTASEVLPWYIGIGVGAWILIGGVAYFVLKEQKSTARTAGKDLAAAL